MVKVPPVTRNWELPAALTLNAELVAVFSPYVFMIPPAKVNFADPSRRICVLAALFLQKYIEPPPLLSVTYFQVNLHCKEEVRTMHAVRSETVEFKSVSFRADTNLKESLKKQKIRRSKNKPHSMPMTEKQIDEKLTEHFAQKPILTRREFQLMCTQVTSTACRILRKLVEAGKLKNISTARNPVYVPDNGHYASVQEK